VFRIGEGRIVARNIIAESLSSITANLGRITGDGNPDDNEYKIVLSDGFSGNANRKGTFLLGPENGESTIRRWWTGSAWKMIIRMTALILENLKSKVIGLLQVFGDWQSHDNAQTKPVFEVSPGEGPNDNDGGAVSVRKTFRAYKNVSDNSVVLEALPNGQTRVQNLQSLNASYVYRNYFVTDASGLDSSKFYFVSFGSSDLELDCEIHSPNLGDAQPFNQNRIHFLLTTQGWYDTRTSFAVLSYSAYDTSEITIGAIVTGDKDGEKGVYVRGGLVYRIKSNAAPVLHNSSYAFGNEVYPSGVAIDNWAGTNTNVLWNYHRGGPYFGENLLMGRASVIGTTPSTGPATGALVVAGGAGVGGDLNAAGVVRAPFLNANSSNGYEIVVTGDRILFYQGYIMKAELKIAMVAGALSLLASGLPLSCEGVTSAGDISGAVADPGVSWTAVGDSKFGTSGIQAVAYGGGKFVAVGYNGKAAYSADGANWTEVGDPKFGTSYILAIAYGTAKFVAGGSDGKAAYSTDGINWTAVSNTTFGMSAIYAITYGGGKFVAGDVGGKMAYSTDGANWTAVGDPKFGTSTINAVAYGGGKFVAVGSSGKAAYSTDGVNWTAVGDPKFGTTQINAIAYASGKFVAVGGSGKAAYSTDGINWTAIGNTTFGTSAIYATTYGGGKFVAVGYNGKAAYSADGANWTAVGDPKFGTSAILAIAYGTAKFVAGGSDGKAAYWTATQARLVFKPDGSVGWTKA
jgi:hypothetical protein